MCRIVCAAIKVGSRVYLAQEGDQYHSDIENRITVPMGLSMERGWHTSEGDWVDRNEAEDLARAAGQVTKRALTFSGGFGLSMEDVVAGILVLDEGG